MRSQRQYIRDILEAMEAAESFAEDVRFEDLEGDLEKQFAPLRKFPTYSPQSFISVHLRAIREHGGQNRNAPEPAVSAAQGRFELQRRLCPRRDSNPHVLSDNGF